MNIFSKYKHCQHYKKLLYACYFFYFCTISTKFVYSVQTIEIINAFNLSKASAAFGLTIYYFMYAAAQFLLSLFITKIDIRRFFLVTTALSAISFSLIGICNNIWQLWLILGLNGIFQSAGWGGITYILGKLFPEDTLSFCTKFLLTGLAVATAAVYAVSSFFVAFFSWKYTFVFFSILYMLSLLIMLYQEHKLEQAITGEPELSFPSKKEKADFVVPKKTHFNKAALMTFLSVLSFLTTSIFYAVGNWIPNLLTEVHSFPSSLSLLITLIMPLVTIPASLLMYAIYDKTNKIIASSLYIGFSLFIIFVLMRFSYKTGLIYAIFMSALLRFLTQSFTASSSSYVAMKFKHHINTGSFPLLLNSLASLGAGLAPFLSGAVMDAFGWDAYYSVLAISTLATLAIALLGYIIIKIRKNLSDVI